ncbi:hypothetical protein, partial [Klebsiella pneumoniae]|uniref:hypothetical protein n=1 Tax=Klebsiella pneumoniae TaxID=573 RepID=UPI0024DEB941
SATPVHPSRRKTAAFFRFFFYISAILPSKPTASHQWGLCSAIGLPSTLTTSANSDPLILLILQK